LAGAPHGSESLNEVIANAKQCTRKQPRITEGKSKMKKRRRTTSRCGVIRGSFSRELLCIRANKGTTIPFAMPSSQTESM